jgi:uncharacterized iron-regulated membrane protein
MKLRSLIFWPHLIAGTLAGSVILLMCVTGVLLTYERQLIAWADSGFVSLRPSPETVPLSMDALLARVRETHPGLAPTAITLRADADAAVTVTAGERTLYLDRYSGAVIGEASRGGVRAFMSNLRAWHRWFAVEGDSRPIARAITGWSNFIFLFIVMSGVYLWFPRKWAWVQVRNVVFFNRRANGRARDFNWHNVIGSWCAIPLFVVVLCAMPISFGWFNAFVYRAVGEEPPQRPGTAAAPSRSAQPPPRRARAADQRSKPAEDSPRSQLPGLAPLWTRAEAHVPGWRTISLRIPPSPSAPVAFTIDKGDGGQPHLRSTLTLDSRTGAVVSYEAFSDLTLGRRIRNTMRFAHTGEVLGIPGQTVAGVVSAGGAVLVWTGLALAFRRFRSWARRRSSQPSRVSTAASAFE